MRHHLLGKGVNDTFQGRDDGVVADLVHEPEVLLQHACQVGHENLRQDNVERFFLDDETKRICGLFFFWRVGDEKGALARNWM